MGFWGDLGSTLREMGSHRRVWNRMVICSDPTPSPSGAAASPCGIFVHLRLHMGSFPKMPNPFSKNCHLPK